MSFDTLIPQQPAKKAASPTPPATTTRTALDAVVKKEIAGTNSPPYPANKKFQGIFLYTTILTQADLQEKYNKFFVEWCVGKAVTSPTGDATNANKAMFVEAVVYIQELCSCLPQPADGKATIAKIKKFIVKAKPKGPIESLRKMDAAAKDPAFIKQLAQIERFPRAYIYQTNSPPGILSKVEVQFFNNYDFSHGKISPGSWG